MHIPRFGEALITLRSRNKRSRRRGRRHDPMLVLNMSIFNFDDRQTRTFGRRNIHENVT
jgi:hypothetical protein